MYTVQQLMLTALYPHMIWRRCISTCYKQFTGFLCAFCQWYLYWSI